MCAWRRGKALAGMVAVVALVVAPSACVGGDGDTAASESGPETTGPEVPEVDSSVADEPEPESERADKASTATPDDEADDASSDGSDDTRGQSDDARGQSDDTRGQGDDAAKSDAEQGHRDRSHGRLFTVTEVVDGDTVHLDKPGETSVRIIGIETPETVHPTEPVECGGPTASKAAERLLAGRQVRLVFDATQGRTDAYGRILGYIDVPGSGDYGLRMIERGYAAEYTYDSAYRRQHRYRAAERRARDDAQGVWGRCGGVDRPLEQPTTEPEPEAQAPPAAGSAAGCAAGYRPCVPSYPPDLDCGDVDGPITITGDDPHGFDADGDGIGCDS